MTEILDRAVEAYRRQWFFNTANEAYARLREHPAAWADWQSELAAWDATLLDGLQDEPSFALAEEGSLQEETGPQP